MNHERCVASTGICGRLTFGQGDLDDHGYWARPCWECARAYEKKDRLPAGTCWPTEASEEVELSYNAAILRTRELTDGGIRHADIPELRELVKKVYHESALRDLINPLFDALQREKVEDGSPH